MDDIIEYLTAVPHGTWQPAKATSPAFAPSASLCAKATPCGSVLQPTKMSIISCSRTPNSSFLHGARPRLDHRYGRSDLNDTAGDEVRKAGYEHMTALGETYEDWGDPRLTFFSLKEALPRSMTLTALPGASSCKGVKAHTTHLHQPRPATNPSRI